MRVHNYQRQSSLPVIVCTEIVTKWNHNIIRVQLHQKVRQNDSYEIQTPISHRFWRIIAGYPNCYTFRNVRVNNTRNYYNSILDAAYINKVTITLTFKILVSSNELLRKSTLRLNRYVKTDDGNKYNITMLVSRFVCLSLFLKIIF